MRDMRFYPYQLWVLVCGALFLAVVVLVSVDAEDHQADVTEAVSALMASDGTLRRIDVPILMYHYVSPLPEDADDIRIGLTTSPEDFRTHIAFLREQGYETVSLDAVHNALTTGVHLPPRPIVLTFDDGYIDHYTYVFPILREYGYTGTFFIITEFADHAHEAHMSWAHIEEMARAGMRMESHTKTHRDLRSRDHDFLVYEILGSIQSLEAHIKQPVQIFSYPAGQYDALTLAVMDELPIGIAVTTRSGRLHSSGNMLELPRLRVSGGMGVAGLNQLLGQSPQ